MTGPKAEVGIVRTFIRTRVTPRVSSLNAKMGFANRNVLAANLKEIRFNGPDGKPQIDEHKKLLDLLESRGIIKSRFRAQISTLNQVDDFMLTTRVGRLKVDNLIQESTETFPGTKASLDNIAVGLYATSNNFLSYMSGSQSGHDNLSLAFVLGAGSAAVIGLTLAGVPAGALIGTSTLYSILSTVVHKHVNSNSNLGKIIEVGRRILPLTLSGSMLYGIVATGGAGLMFSEVFSNMLGDIPSYLLPLIGLGTMGAVTTAWSLVDTHKAKNTRLGHLDPLSEKHVRSVIWRSNLKTATGFNYMLYRTILYGAFVGCAIAFNFSPFSLLGLLGGLLPRLLVSKTRRERLTEKTWDKALGIVSLLRKTLSKNKKPINSDDHPLAKLLVEYSAGMAIKYGAFLTVALSLAANPLDALFDLLTMYFGAATIFADVHSQTASIGLALDWKRSMFNAMEMQISDAELKKTKNITARAIAYINDVDRNFAKIANMLLMESPHVEALFCGELHPLNNLGAVRQLRAAREAHALMAKWQRELYDEVHVGYKNSTSIDPTDRKAVNGLGNNLVDLLKTLADHYITMGDKGYVPRLMKMVGQEDKQRPGPDKWFALAGDEAYVRTTYEAIRLRGLVYLQASKDIQDEIKDGTISGKDLQDAYRELLTLYRTTFVHFQRKLESLDDMLGTKTANLSSMESHMGDTLYHVWKMEPLNGKERLITHLIPSTYVRVKNPRYNDLPGASPENMPYMWIRREDFLKVLGLSQSISNDIQLVDNTPANIKEIEKPKLTYKHGEETLTVRGFYSNQETLPVNHLIDWNGNTIPNSNDIWIATQPAPPQFTDRFREWARSHYTLTEDEFNNLAKDLGSTPANLLQQGFVVFQNPQETKKEFKKYVVATDWQNNTFYQGLGENQQKRVLTSLTYDAWMTQQPNSTLWFIDRPEVLVVSPAENYNVCDEAYIVWNTERVLSAELNKTAETNKILRVVNYVSHKARYPNPDPTREVAHVRNWKLEDSPIGIKYKAKVTVNGEEVVQEFNIPYQENRTSFATGLGNDAWKNIKYGIIRPDVDGPGKHVIDIYDNKDKKMGQVTTEWPHHMHRPDQIEGGRIEINVFPERVGMATWLVADYGDNYGQEPYNRYRCAFLDFDLEAKQEFWPNFITDLTAGKDNKQLTFTSISTKCETFPFDKRWARIKHARQAEVLEVSAIPTRPEVAKDNSGWKPIRDGKPTSTILLARLADGSEKVFDLNGLPGSLQELPAIRRIIDARMRAEGLEIVQTRLRNKVQDNPSFIYSVPPALAEDNPEMRKIKMLLKKQDLTVHFTRDKDGKITAELYDALGSKLDLTLPIESLHDNAGKGFLLNSRYHMDSLDSFYQREDHSYEGTEEYRPRLIIVDGKIKLILTRVEKTIVKKSKANADTLDKLAGLDNVKQIFIARPTSAVKIKITSESGKEEIKWVPASLTNPIVHEPAPNQARIAVKGTDGKVKYLRTPLIGDLPGKTYFLKFENNKFVAYTMSSIRKENNALVATHVPIEEAVSSEITKQLLDAVKEKGTADLNSAEISVEIFYTRTPEIIDGEYQSVVHGQRQHGLFYEDEASTAGAQGQFRDSLFYGNVKGLFSEALPGLLEPRSGGIQIGRDQDYDANDKWSGKPIENGTQFVGQHKHLFELAEVLMGVPKGGLIAYAQTLGRYGGFEAMMHKPHFSKLVLYCREKGWLTGVSEDEQGVLALSLALGYTLKYFVRVTAFESQPTTYGQIDGQDARRYNTALALGADVLIPYEQGEISQRAAGKEISSTWKNKFSHFLFRMWYEWPKAELARELSPAAYLFSNGRIKPYIVDPYFLLSYFIDFGAGLAMYKGARNMLGYNTDYTSHTAFRWSFIEGPAMNQAYFFQSTRGIVELFRKGWQYGQFVVTAQQKDNPKIAEVNKDFLRHLAGIQFSASGFGLLTTIPGMLSVGDPQLTLEFIAKFGSNYIGYFFNEFWSCYIGAINLYSLKHIKECEISHPKADAKNPEVKAFRTARQAAIKAINEESIRIGNLFFEGVKEFNAGNRAKAEEIFRYIVEPNRPYVMPNYLLLSIDYLEKLGIDRKGLKIGKKAEKEEVISK